MKIWNKYYECSCHAHTIMAHYEDDKEYGKTVDLAFFSNHINSCMPWSQRLRFIWKILKTGIPWADAVVLDIEEAKQLGEDLVKFIDKGIVE